MHNVSALLRRKAVRFYEYHPVRDCSPGNAKPRRHENPLLGK
jgi:hypothetical protein